MLSASGEVSPSTWWVKSRQSCVMTIPPRLARMNRTASRGDVLLGSTPVGPVAVRQPGEDGGDRRGQELGGVRVPGEESGGSVLDQVEQADVNHVAAAPTMPNCMNSLIRAMSR